MFYTLADRNLRFEILASLWRAGPPCTQGFPRCPVPISYSPSFPQAVASPKSCPARKLLSPPKEILNLCPFQMAVLSLPWVYMETQISTICVSCNNSFSTCRKVAISILSAVESGPERTPPMLSQGTGEVSIQTKTYRERTAISKLMLLIRRYL